MRRYEHKKSIIALLISVVLAYDVDVSAMPADNYYSDANLARLHTAGIRKHAPLILIIDQDDNENPDNMSFALTQDLAGILQTAFIPAIVSCSIVYNYFVRRDRNGEDDMPFGPEHNPVSFKAWRLYDIPHSQFFLFVPNHYGQHYKDTLSFNIQHLIDISEQLPIAENYEHIQRYIESRQSAPPFSINDLRTVLAAIQPGNKGQLTKQEREQQGQRPIWDIILHGHGSYGNNIGGLSPDQIQKLLAFFNTELSVGTLYILSCDAGGENLNLLEFDRTVNKEHILRSLDYILIVGSITDMPIYGFERTSEVYYRFYNNAAWLQDRGKSLDLLLYDLSIFYRHPFSLHGSSALPQVWLPQGLGFQTYQINDKVQILGQVRVRAHEDEHRAIRLPNSTVVLLLYVMSVDVPLLIWPHIMDPADLIISRGVEVASRTLRWGNVPNIAELLKKSKTKFLVEGGLKKKIASALHHYPALVHMLTKLADVPTFEQIPDGWYNIGSAINLIYPEFISMLRGDLTTQYIQKIELQPPVGKERELTGVLHFIRDAFFDMGDRATMKSFLLEELVGNNDISALLELHRLLDRNIKEPYPLELKLRSAIGKRITLRKIYIMTKHDSAYIRFIYDNTAWEFSFVISEETLSPDFWKFEQIDLKEYDNDFALTKQCVTSKSSIQTSMRDVLLKKAAIVKIGNQT